MIFLLAVTLSFWGLNIFRHINSGNWRGLRKTADIAGALILLIALVGLAVPVVALKGR